MEKCARVLTVLRHSSNRATVRAGLCTRNIISIFPANWRSSALPDDQLELKIISTTRLDECPSGSSVRDRNELEECRDGANGEGGNGTGTGFLFRRGLGLLEGCFGRTKTDSLEMAVQDREMRGLSFFGVEATSSRTFDLHWRDRTQPLAMNRTGGEKKRVLVWFGFLIWRGFRREERRRGGEDK